MGKVGVMVLQLLLEPFFDVQVIVKGNIKEDNEFLSNSWEVNYSSAVVEN